MPNPYPFELSVGGVVKESGDLTFTDSGNQPGGGSLPAWWTTTDSPNTAEFDGTLALAPSGETDTPLTLTQIDPNGVALFLNFLDYNGNQAFAFDTSGDLVMNGVATEGPSGIIMNSVDKPSYNTQIYSGHMQIRKSNTDSGSALFDAADSGSGGGFGVDAFGTPYFHGVNVPTVFPNYAAMWFDSTNGAAKIKFKGQTADGTPVVGEIALA